MPKERDDLLRGTLDMLVLKTLAGEARHGYAIVSRIQQMSGDVLQVEEGSLYPALHRMERRGWLRAQWGLSESNRRAKYYRITGAGRKQLAASRESWARVSGAIGKILRAQAAGG